MDRFGCFLMLILVFCFPSACGTAGVSSTAPVQTSSNEDRVIDQKELQKVTVSRGQEQAGKNAEASDLPEQMIDGAPFAEDRFTHRPTRTGGMPTIQYPKSIPYAENKPLLARE